MRAERSSHLTGFSRATEFALLFFLLVLPCQLVHGKGSDQIDIAVDQWASDLDERSARLHRLTWDRFKEVTQSAGISSNFVYDFDQDDQGFIWMGTRNGLDRYDGYSVRNFRHQPNSKTSLASSDIRTIAAAANGIVWAGSHAAGLDRFDSVFGTATNFRNSPGHPNDIGDDHVNKVIIDKSGDIWVATQKAGLSFINHRTLEVTRFHTAAGGKFRIPSDEVITIFTGLKGRVWAGTGSGLIFAENSGSGFEQLDLDIKGIAHPAIIQSLQQASDGTLYVMTSDQNALQVRWHENARFEVKNLGNIQAEAKLGPDSFSLIDRYDRLWIYGGDGLIVYDPVIEGFVTLPVDLRAMFEDHTGTIWISQNPGVYRLNPDVLMFGDLVHEIKSHVGVSLDHIFAILEPSDGSVFLSDPSGVWWYEPGTHEFRAFTVNSTGSSNPNDSNDTNTLFQDQDGLVWAGTFSAGINRIDPVTGLSRSYRLCEPAGSNNLCNRVWVIQGDAEGTLWVGSARDFLSYESSHDSFNSVPVPEGHVQNMILSGVRALAIGRHNVMWVGTERGLLRWHRDSNDWQWFVHDPSDANSLSSNYVNALHEDDKGVLWVGTQLGAHRLDSETGEIRRFNSGTGLPNDDIHSLVEDIYGTIWMSTGEGLVSMDKVTFEITVYDRENGLTNDEFLLAAGHAGKSGKVYFGGVGSLVYFDPGRITSNDILPQVALTGLRVNNERVIPDDSDPAALLSTSINMTDSIELHHQQANFSVDFAAMHFADPANSRYAYRLLGLDDKWTYTDSNHRSASYTHLPSGSYTLQVKAANGDGNWGEVSRPLTITILAPIWATWWAYLLYGLAISMFVFLFIQLRTRTLVGRAKNLEQIVQARTRQIKENEHLIQTQAKNLEQLLHLKEKLFTNISHEFRTPLTLILGPVNRMLNSDITQEQASRLKLVKQNGQRLLRLVDQLMALSRLEAEEPNEWKPQPISKFVTKIGKSFGSLARSRNIAFEVQVDDGLWVNASADALEKILMNLLSNAFKYTHRGGHISMNLASGCRERVAITISDSGIGIPHERQASVFDRFNRVVDASESVPGAGIGLSLASELVDALDGSIDLTSAPGEGTAMTVNLPGIPDPLPTTAVESDIVLSESSNMELDNLSRSGFIASETVNGDEQLNPTILVIEDNPGMQQYMVELLSPHYTCLVAGDGQSGMEIGLDQVPDLILCDVMLPKKDGYKVSQVLKSDERSSHIPIIMLTARGDHDSRLKGLREKVDDYMAKPFDDEELLLRIANILAARETLRNKFTVGFNENGDSGYDLGKRDRVFLTKLDTVIENHLADPKFRIELLTSQMAMSERNLQRKLKALAGHTPGQYLRTYRLKKALVLLREGIPVNLVAERVGFSSPAYFSSCFREEFDQSPSQYSKR